MPRGAGDGGDGTGAEGRIDGAEGRKALERAIRSEDRTGC